jgi:hypothetical protein
MMNFNQWYDAVGELVYDETGLDIDYLPDENYRLNYDVGVTVFTMSEIIISNNTSE